MPEPARPVIYWDASAVLSVLIRDAHSTSASAMARRALTHLISTLAYAEVIAVIARLERNRDVATLLADAARELLRDGPWRRLVLQPDWAEIDELASNWPLRGADLWHLATAMTLRRELPEVRMATFDSRLGAAAGELGLAL
ncbi:MAG TPA: type II toxin-antitoxin system VapC family toxin [Candidatus Sulfotelmatobacter sp.]|nr:type II toxin-antitoxin system VapC family toxin [Candidatus Sulfotelmatobacter sp.]